MKKSILLVLFLILTLFIISSLSAQTENQDSIKNQLTQSTDSLKRGLDPEACDTDTAIANQVVADEEQTQREEPKPKGVVDYLLTGKYLSFFGLAFVGAILVFRRWVNKPVRIIMLAVAFVLFGLDYIYPLHPSPMCGLTKLFMFNFTWGKFFPAFLVIVLAMFIPSLIGRKLFCGWVCPLGAFQDLINKIPFKKIKRFNFTAFNTVRFALLLMFVLVFFAVKNHITYLGTSLEADITQQTWVAYSAFSIYDPINFFELLHWNVDTLFIIMMSLLVIASLVLYRPFCYLLCPIGALTWLCEKISPLRIYVDQEKCTKCGECLKKSPCPTIYHLVENDSKALPDCTSCGECLGHCLEENAISFGVYK